MIYLDTNVLISLHVFDSTAAAAAAWIAQQSAPLAMSTWSIAEFRGNVALRTRKKEILPHIAARILEEFDTEFSAEMIALPVTDSAHWRAARWLREPACALQPGDALHLAIAIEYDAAALATFDQRFARGIEKLRIPGFRVIALPADGGLPQIQQRRAEYIVTERDIAKAVKWARKRREAERERAPRLLVRGG